MVADVELLPGGGQTIKAFVPPPVICSGIRAPAADRTASANVFEMSRSCFMALQNLSRSGNGS